MKIDLLTLLKSMRLATHQYCTVHVFVFVGYCQDGNIIYLSVSIGHYVLYTISLDVLVDIFANYLRIAI